MLASLVLTAAVIYLPGISDAFGFTHISLAEYAVALGLAVCVIPIVELVKACQRAWPKPGPGKAPAARPGKHGSMSQRAKCLPLLRAEKAACGNLNRPTCADSTKGAYVGKYEVLSGEASRQRCLSSL